MKLFADDTSLFTILQDPAVAARDMNHDLALTTLWAIDCRMSFNPDPRKQAIELLFSSKNAKVDHSVIPFNDVPASTVDQHKHLGITLDAKLSSSAHVQAAIAKSRKSIGMLKFMSKYMTRSTLSELYKLYVRPHYGNVFHHVPLRDACSGTYLMEKLESVQILCCLCSDRNLERNIAGKVLQ